MKPKIQKKSNPKQEAYRKLMARKSELLKRASGAGAFSKQIRTAYSAYNISLARFVLQHELGIKDSQTTKVICSAIRAKAKPQNSMSRDMKIKVKYLSVSHDARAEQQQAKAREKICKILGREKGEIFWNAFKKIRSEGYGKNNQGK